MNIKNVIVLMCALLLYSGVVSAQKVISGRVYDSMDRTTLIGATVVQQGTTRGTVTDVQGNFSFTLSPDHAEVLVVTFIGYMEEVIDVANRTTIQVYLSPTIESLEGVVVIGYGVQRKADLTSSITTVRAEDISRAPVPSLQQALQGLAPGVEVTADNGSPGGNIRVRIRGTGSITGGTDPLYVIDGIPGSSNSVNPNDIESVQILKDAAASAIYGSRGANGVILITTKRGKAGATQINYNTYFGNQQLPRKLDLMNATEWAMFNKEKGGHVPRADSILMNPAQYGNGTDWQDAVFSNAMQQNHNVNVSGGSENATFNFSANYFDQDGIMVGTYFQRYQVRLNSDFTIGRLKIGESLSIRQSQRQGDLASGGRSVVDHMIRMTPGIKAIDPDNPTGFGGSHNVLDAHDAVNPLVRNAFRHDDSYDRGLLGNVYAELEILKNLTYRFNTGIDHNMSDSRVFSPAFYNASGAGSFRNTDELTQSYNAGTNFIIENILTYKRTSRRHDITLLAGYTEERYQSRGFSASADSFPTSTIQQFNLAGNITSLTSNIQQDALRSFLGRVLYSFDNKYLFTVNFRQDGSSRFGDGNKYGFFPSASLGWKLTEENFMHGIRDFADIKFRASYGAIGNQNIGRYLYEANLHNSTIGYIINNQRVDGLVQTRFGTPDIQWETSIQSNYGLDVSLLQDKIILTADYYYNTTRDMLLQVPIPVSTGNSRFTPWVNLPDARLINSGLELSLSWREIRKDFNYSITGNFSTINNRVENMGGQVITGGQTNILGFITRTEEGRSIGDFYTFVTDGLYQEGEDISKGIAPFGQPGDIRFKDLNGDGQINDHDRTYVGSPIPDFTYGLNLNASYGSFDGYVFFQGVHGNKIFNYTRYRLDNSTTNENAGRVVLDRYRSNPYEVTNALGEVIAVLPANTTTNVPRAVNGDPNSNFSRVSDRYIEDGSYLRLKNIVLGYTLPASVSQSMAIRNLRVYVQAQNLLTFTKYSGYDPELGSAAGGTSFQTGNSNTARGIDNGQFPQPRVFLVGVQAGF
jgi:TonB-dependent starch-binding outer membrane protein SusC